MKNHVPATDVQQPMSRSLALAFAVVALTLVGSEARQAPRPLFDFRVSFWNSLHHELHAVVWPRPAPATASAEDTPETARAGWARAVLPQHVRPQVKEAGSPVPRGSGGGRWAEVLGDLAVCCVRGLATEGPWNPRFLC